MNAPKGYTPPPEDAGVIILTCLPRDTSKLPKVGVEPRKPTITDTLSQCRNVECGQDIWVGEKQKYLLDTETRRIVLTLCYMCAAAASGGDMPIYKLGPDQDSPVRT